MEELQPVGRCPVCAYPVTDDDEGISCQRCQTVHHRDCWEYVGSRCALFGCDEKGWQLQQQAPAEWLELDKNMRWWLFVYKLHWTSFGVIVSGFACTLLTIISALVLDFMTYGSATPWLLPLRWLGIVLGCGGFLVAALAAPVYLLLALPSVLLRYRVQRVLGHTVGPPPAEQSRAIADRLDQPLIGRVVARLFVVAEYFILVLFFFFLFCLLFAKLNIMPSFLRNNYYSFVYGNVLFFLPFLWLLLIKPVQRLTKHRMDYLSSLQNRVVASFKGKQLPRSS